MMKRASASGEKNKAHKLLQAGFLSALAAHLKNEAGHTPWPGWSRKSRLACVLTPLMAVSDGLKMTIFLAFS
ncbi:hypothetical protein ACFS07_02515 [Undibacterium arcticum]